MSRAKKLLETVTDLGPHMSEVSYGKAKLLFCWHTVCAFKDVYGSTYVTTDEVTPEMRDMINQWAGRNAKPMSQRDLERATYMMARTMESLVNEDTTPSGYKYVKNPTSIRSIERNLQPKDKNPWVKGEKEVRILADF